MPVSQASPGGSARSCATAANPRAPLGSATSIAGAAVVEAAEAVQGELGDGRQLWFERALTAVFGTVLHVLAVGAWERRASRKRSIFRIAELGIEPGRGLRELHQAILDQAPGLEAQPRPATPSALSNRALPVPPNRTIGREHDIVAVGERLRAESVRLLTLTGPGGVGKTRLALEAARAVEADFADGACFVSLAALHRPEDVPAAIVKTLAIVVLSSESVDQAAERFLAAKHLLLITDNFEQLLTAAPFIGRLLEVCPLLTILATIREPLALQAEERYLVSPLALPEPGVPQGPGALADTDAVALFCERARAHDPDFELGDANAAAAAEICRRVDGLPLAIELAAARCGLLSPTEIADRLDGALGAPGAGARDAPARQQTLRATIDWSHELLTHAERQCFARFSVFAGGATVDAVETINAGGLDTLDGLVTKSLLARRQHALAATRLGNARDDPRLRRRALRLRRRYRGRARGPLSLLPRARPAPRNRTRASGCRRRLKSNPACNMRTGLLVLAPR